MIKPLVAIGLLNLIQLFSLNAHAISNADLGSNTLNISQRVAAVDIDFGNDLHKGRQVKGSCSGVIISDSLILTAGHCLQIHNGIFHKPLSIGFYDTSGEKIIERRSVLYAALPGVYNPSTLYADMGIVKIDGRIPESAVSSELFKDLSALKVGTDLIDAGIGMDDKKQFGKVRASEFSIRSLNGSSIGIIGKKKNVDVCGGDSGGPLFIRKGDSLFIAGINSTSFDHDCNHGTYSATATLVPRFGFTWISGIAKMPEPTKCTECSIHFIY